MIKFNVKNTDLIRFLEKSAANGYVSISATEKVKRNFFGRFFVDVKDGILYITATDSGEQRMFIRHKLKGVEIIEEGTLPISDLDLILDVLRSIPRNRKIKFEYDDAKRFLVVETIDEGSYKGFRVRQEEPDEKTIIGLENSKVGVENFEKTFTFEEGKPKITIVDDEGGIHSATYDTIIDFKKSELSDVIKDSVKLTLDQDIQLSLDTGKVIFESGKKADPVKSVSEIKKEIEKPIVVNRKIITNLHPIIDHLFDKFKFYCRMASDNSLKFWIRSEEDPIELNFCSSSV